jgi:DNA-binding NtrC family response regulator
MRKNYILVADDSKPILHATTLWLNKHCPDNPVLTAENHSDAMELFHEHTVHAVISDYAMPKSGDGLKPSSFKSSLTRGETPWGM